MGLRQCMQGAATRRLRGTPDVNAERKNKAQSDQVRFHSAYICGARSRCQAHQKTAAITAAVPISITMIKAEF